MRITDFSIAPNEDFDDLKEAVDSAFDSYLKNYKDL